MGWCPHSTRGIPLWSVVPVVLWSARFPLCPRGGLPSSCPSAFLGRVRILPLGVDAGILGEPRISGEVLITRDLGCLRPWGSGVTVGLGRCICPGGALSGWRVAVGGRTRALAVGEGGRISARQGPRSVSTRGRGVSRCRTGLAVSGKDGRG